LSGSTAVSRKVVYFENEDTDVARANVGHDGREKVVVKVEAITGSVLLRFTQHGEHRSIEVKGKQEKWGEWGK
jgi:hypothetical protein